MTRCRNDVNVPVYGHTHRHPPYLSKMTRRAQAA